MCYLLRTGRMAAGLRRVGTIREISRGCEGLGGQGLLEGRLWVQAGEREVDAGKARWTGAAGHGLALVCPEHTQREGQPRKRLRQRKDE